MMFSSLRMNPHHVPNAGEVIGHEGPIPGEREIDTLTHAEPGALGGGVAGERLPFTRDPIAIGDEVRDEIERDGGGDVRERRR